KGTCSWIWNPSSSPTVKSCRSSSLMRPRNQLVNVCSQLKHGKHLMTPPSASCVRHAHLRVQYFGPTGSILALQLLSMPIGSFVTTVTKVVTCVLRSSTIRKGYGAAVPHSTAPMHAHAAFKLPKLSLK